MTYEQMGREMHIAAALGLLCTLWMWVDTLRDFLAGVARIEKSWLLRFMDGERDLLSFAKPSDPLGFWSVTAIKAAILTGITYICAMLLVAP